MPRKSAKFRTPDDIRQTAVRMREHEHAQLVAAAKDHRTTLNAEIMWRVMRTFELDTAHLVRLSVTEARVELERAVNEVGQRLRPYLIDAHERDLVGDALFAARRLADENSAWIAADHIEGRDAQRARAIIDDFHLARRDLEIAFGEKVIAQGTPGFRARAEARRKAAGGETPSNEETRS